MNAPRFYKRKTALPPGTKTIDTLLSAYSELFYIEHPQVSKNNPQATILLKKYLEKTKMSGVWVYYPKIKTALHIPTEKVYFRLRTARNRNLILEAQQEKYRQAVVGIAGLSVGSAVVASLVATGGPKFLKIADPDVIEITNLNRMRATLFHVGRNKAEAAAEQVWEIDPFAKVEVWEKGIHEKDLKKFLIKKPRLDVCVDEMDDIVMKIAIRLSCRTARIPVVMATDNGDSIIVDIERFDLEPERALFHGKVNIAESKLTRLTRRQFIELSTKIIDPNYFTTQQQSSILAIGTELAGIPQLGTAAAIAGAAVSYVVRKIVTGEKLPSGRYVMGCESTFIPGYTGAHQKSKRRRHTLKFIKALALSKEE